MFGEVVLLFLFGKYFLRFTKPSKCWPSVVYWFEIEMHYFNIITPTRRINENNWRGTVRFMDDISVFLPRLQEPFFFANIFR